MLSPQTSVNNRGTPCGALTLQRYSAHDLSLALDSPTSHPHVLHNPGSLPSRCHTVSAAVDNIFHRPYYNDYILYRTY